MNGNFLLFGSPATSSSFMMTQNSQQDLSKYHSLPFQVSMLQELFIIFFYFFFILQFGIYGVRVYYIISICVGGGVVLRRKAAWRAQTQTHTKRRSPSTAS